MGIKDRSIINIRLRLQLSIDLLVGLYQGVDSAQRMSFTKAISNIETPTDQTFKVMSDSLMKRKHSSAVSIERSIIDQLIATARHINVDTVFDDDGYDDSTILKKLQFDLIERVMTSVNAQLSRDVSDLKRRFLTYMLDVEIFSKSMGEIEARGLAREKHSAFNSKYVDSLGRNWKSERFLKSEFTHFLYRFVNMNLLSEHLAANKATATIDRPDSKFHNETFQIADYPAIESKVFYPGSISIISHK